MTDDLITRFRTRWQFARGLTRDLLRSVDAYDLVFSPGDGLGALWKHFRHLGRVQENYLRAIETRKVVFSFEDATYTGGDSRRALLDYLDRVDTHLEQHFDAIDATRRIDWFGTAVDVHEHLNRMADHEVLHHGMFVVYIRLLGKPFPSSWVHWGL
jgi:uncharacterized damage-inducible protein DinB